MTGMPNSIPISLPDDADPAERNAAEASWFAALTNLMYAVAADAARSPAECGGILYRHAMPLVDDESRMRARVIMAWLDLRFTETQPIHEPGSGCRFADPAGNCEFHATGPTNELLDRIAGELAVGAGGAEVPAGDSPAGETFEQAQPPSSHFPEGRTIFYEGTDPDGFAAQIKAEFGFDPSQTLARDVGDGRPFHGWNEDFGWAFHCPPEHLDAIYGSGRFPMGS